MADKKSWAKAASKVSSKPRPYVVPRLSTVPAGANAPKNIAAADSGGKAISSSWGTLTAAEVGSPSPEVPATTMSSLPLNALGLPDTSLLEKKSMELGGITERLHRALGDIATLYDENGEEELDPEIDYERRQYMARLEALNERVRSIEGDREQLLRSLNGNGGRFDNFQDDEEHDREVPSPLSSLRERMATTQSGYLKLRDLNQQMLMMKRPGKQEENDLVSEVDMQAEVISRFKEMFNARKTKAVDRSFGSHWKHAAGEIVGLLSRVRHDGQMDLEKVRRTLENTEQLISKQVEALARLEERVYDKQEEINKGKNDFSVLENENDLLKSEVKQYRSQVVELKKKIKKLEAQLKNATTSDKSEAESENGAQVRTRPVPESTTVTEPAAELATGVKSRRTFKQKKDRGRDVTEVKEENEKLIDKVTTLEMKVIEKETKNMRMEHDVSEMLENIRSASPEAIKHLRRSIDLARYLPEVEEDEDDDPSKEVAIHVAGSVTSPNGAIPSTSTRTASRSYSISPRSKGRSAKRHTGGTAVISPAQVLQNLRTSSQKTDDRTESAEGFEPTLADFNREREHCTRLASELESVKKELARAKREIVGLQFGSNRTYAMTDRADKTPNDRKEIEDKSAPPTTQQSIGEEEKPTKRAKVSRNWQRLRNSIQPPNVSELLAKESSTTDKPSDERTLYEQLKAQGLHNAAARRNVRVIRKPMTPRKATGIAGEGEDEKAPSRKNDEGEEILDDEGNLLSFEEFDLVDQGMQTDPLLDPLAAWSNVKSVDMKAHHQRSTSPRRGYTRSPRPLPAPPEEWAQFDPTPITAPSGKMGDRTHMQKKGGSSRPGSAVEGFFFVERELSRLITGIRGFTSYVSQLLDREVSEIAKTNDEIRMKLSERSLRRYEKMICGNEQQDDHGLNGKPTIPPIRRGRFEIVRDDNQTSHFANRVAFASYTTGRRSSVVPEVGATSKSETSNVADSLRFFLPIMEYLQGADAEAQRRLVQELSSGKGMLTSCQRWNLEVELIGKHAIDVLKGICDFFRNTVDKQTREHEVLSEGMRMKEEIQKAFRGPLPDDISLKLKRSLSISLLEPGHALAGKGLHPASLPVQSKSMSSIQSSHRYLPSLMIPRAQAPTNRDEMIPVKTVLPRKGMVRLQAVGKPTVDDKPTGPKRRHRPAPQSHRKLLAKQEIVLRRASDGDEKSKEPTTLKHVILQLEEPGSVRRRKRMYCNKKDVIGRKTIRKNLGALGPREMTSVRKATKRPLDTGEQLRGKILKVFSS